MHAAVLCSPNLARDGLIAADANGGPSPDARHDRNSNSKGALGHGHEGIKQLLVNEVERCANKLGNDDAEATNTLVYILRCRMFGRGLYLPDATRQKVDREGQAAQKFDKWAMACFSRWVGDSLRLRR